MTQQTKEAAKNRPTLSNPNVGHLATMPEGHAARRLLVRRCLSVTV